MDYLEAKTNQLVVETAETKEKSKTFVRSFATKPSASLAGKKGKIFGLVEIEATDKKIPELIDLIIEEIKNNYYYQNDLKEEQESSSISDHFEVALKKTNLAIAAFLESEQISLDLEKVNIFLAVTLNQKLHFTLVGDMGVILFYNLSPTNYRIINILEISQSPLTPPDPLKFFSQIISGRIRSRDILFISTVNVLDYFSLEKIKNIITEKVPAEGIAELRQLIEKIESKEDFGILVLEVKKITVPIKKPIANLQEFDYHQAATKDSIKELIRTEKETEKLLTPSLLPEIKKYTSSLKTALQNYLDKIKSSTTTFYQKQKNVRRPNFKLKSKIKKVSKISQTGKKILQLISSFVKKIILSISKQPIWGKLLLLFRKLFNNLIIRFKRLPSFSKVLLIITIILAILFSQSIIWLGYKNQKQKKLENFNQIIIEVETKKNDAESSLIYRDENQAREMLLAAKNLLAGAQPFLKTQKEQIRILNQEIEEKLEKLRHFINIVEPIQIVNFANLDSQANIANLVILNQKIIYTQNTNNQSIYKANLETRVLAAIYSPDSNTGSLTLGTAINADEIVFLNKEKKAFRLDPKTDSLKPVAININNQANIADVTAYNNRLYLLDPTAGQIYRYTKTGSGYGDLQNWLREESQKIADAVSLAVDGSIYLLKANGEVLKLQGGEITDFKLKKIDPKLESPTKIKTTEDSKYLYILDPPTKRLIVLDKEGNLINQYTSPAFTNLKDFVVMEKEKEIYVLNGTLIFGLPAEHLK